MYIQFRKPQQEEIAKLISEVRGTRSLMKFADDIKRTSPNIKVSASTLSRASNCGDNPVSIELLEAIAEVSQNKEEIFAKLLEANGTRSQEDDKQLTQKSAIELRREYRIQFENSVKMLLQNEIVERDYPVRALSSFFKGNNLHGYMAQNDRVFPRNFDFGFSVSGMSPCSTWKFMLSSLRLPAGSQAPLEAHVGNFINRAAGVFASDGFESELYENEKYSFVFVDKKLFDAFVKRLEDHNILVNGLMTIILVDVDTNSVVIEKQIKRYDGEEATSFFKQPISKDTSDDLLTDPFEIIDDIEEDNE